MDEVDDRLAGDPIWELFPSAKDVSLTASQFLLRLCKLVACCAALWLVYPPLAVVIACVAVAVRDFQIGRRLSRSIPVKSGGTICSRFRYAWGAWKACWMAWALMMATLFILGGGVKNGDVPPGFVPAILVWITAFTLSATWTAYGLAATYRSGMKIWIGEGLNHARQLLLGLALGGFTLVMWVPIGIWIVGKVIWAPEGAGYETIIVIVMIVWLLGSLAMLPVVDRLSPSVVASHPGKFGPKVPAVGKWDA
jgi:hypothetical protein